jgi:hypothetical protein
MVVVLVLFVAEVFPHMPDPFMTVSGGYHDVVDIAKLVLDAFLQECRNIIVLKWLEVFKS